MTKPNERQCASSFDESIDFLSVRPEGTYADCTVGLAGHSEGFLRPVGQEKGHLIGFDRDPEALETGQRVRLGRVVNEMGSEAPVITLIGEAFSSISKHVKPGSLNGLLADFGVSSHAV